MKEKNKIQKKKNMDFLLKKEINYDVTLDKGKMVAEDRSEKEVRENDHGNEEVVNSGNHNADFDVILDGSRSLERNEEFNKVHEKIVLVDDQDFDDVAQDKDNDFNEEGTSGKENELSVTQLLDDPNFGAEIERNALAIMAKQSTTPVVFSEPLVGSVGVEEETSHQELIEASTIISQIHLGKQKVQLA
ncbi:hypothetical protein L1887_15788 [Cichorium endivia]|nr:hypothetical protein L1887_15788 [Cichorium endivia]